MEMNDDPGAERTFARAEQLAPDNPEPRLGRGLAVLMQGRREEAAQVWRPVIANAGSRRILETMVSLYRSLGDEAAANEAATALARQPAGAP
jgi:hypothetical protein